MKTFPLLRPYVSTAVAFMVASLLAVPGRAQVPDALKHNIPAVHTGSQGGTQLGDRVAVEGAYTVAAAPGVFNGLDSDGDAFARGAVKVFDTTSGALLHTLPRPLGADEEFGHSLSISGTRIVVGSPGDYVTSPGRVFVYDMSSPTPTKPVWELENPNFVIDERFGSSVAISGMRIVVGDPAKSTGASNSGVAYVYDLNSATPTVPVATLNNPSPTAADRFGASVAISGSRVLVGTPAEEAGTNQGGSVYVYELAGPSPTVAVSTLHNPSPAVGDTFGSAVAISGTRLVVGAEGDDWGRPDAGSAYLYSLEGATPSVPVATLNNPSAATTKQFGRSVAISGTRVVVGGERPDDSAVAASVYVYESNSATPLELVKLSSLSLNDLFGISVAVSGSRVVVGAPGDDAEAPDSGSAYTYDLSSPVPAVASTILRSPFPLPSDAFGLSVAISGTRMVVGAPGTNGGAQTAGRVSVYDLAGGTPTAPVATLGKFGGTVAIAGTRIVVLEAGTAAGSAAIADVYDLRSGTPTVPVLTLNRPKTNYGDNFGVSAAISGARVVVGAGFADTDVNNAGMAYVFDLDSVSPTAAVAVLHNPNPRDGDYFGSAVSISGTLVVVGTNREFEGPSIPANVYVYDLSSATPMVPVRTLTNPGTPSSETESDRFGRAVAISGSRVLVGAHRHRGNGTIGSVYYYDLSRPNPTIPIATLTHPPTPAGEAFGFSVAISGSRAVVGATYAATSGGGAYSAGKAYVYELAGPTPTVPVATLANPSPDYQDYFGWSVSIDGTTVAAGAPFDDTSAIDKGAAYVFAPANPDFDGDGLLDIWEHARFGTTAGHSALDDSDLDGRVELLEQAFDTDPTRSDATAAPRVVNEDGYLMLTLTKRAGVAYLGQSAATPDPAAFSTATTQVLINNATTLKVRDIVAVGSAPRRFMRVQVSAAP